MLADKNLVRHLDSCETMACATAICRYACRAHAVHCKVSADGLAAVLTLRFLQMESQQCSHSSYPAWSPSYAHTVCVARRRAGREV